MPGVMNPPDSRCPLCGTGEVAPNRRPAEPGLLRCNECRLVFRNRPNLTFGSRKPTEDLERLNAYREELFAYGLGVLAPHRQTGNLLDIGSGPGGFVHQAADTGWNAFGLEPDQGVLRATPRTYRASIACGVAEALPFVAGEADAVTFWDSLDIVPDPVAALRQARLALRPGGALLIRIRNGPLHLFLRRVPLVPNSFSVLHTTIFSRRTLREALELAGFESVRVGPSPITTHDAYDRSAGAARLFDLGKRAGSLVAKGVSSASRERLLICASLLAMARRPQQ
jgi:SAM-dependent methyltransferase